MTIYKIIGDNIRGIREKKGWTQEKLGVRANLNDKYIGCIERAEKKASIDALLVIAKVLHIDFYKLFIIDSHKDN